MRTLPNLDFLRAVAVISVVVEHTLLAYGFTNIGRLQVPWLGVVGVFLFFVHTTLVLMWSLERKPHTLDFYIRRAFRIYPLAILAIAVTLLLHAPVSAGEGSYFYFKPFVHRSDLLSSFLLMPNLFGGYSPVGVMWSLPYEVQMYLFLPVLFFFVQRNFSLWPLMMLWAFWVAACRPAFVNILNNFFLCVPYFLPGVMAYVGFGRRRATLPAWTFPIGLCLAWVIFLDHPKWRAANYLCLAVGLLLPSFHQLTWTPLVRISHQLAKYSYGIYLGHPFAIVLGLHCMPHAPLALQLLTMFGSLCLLSWTAYHYVEHPMIRLGSRLASKAEQRIEQVEKQHFRIPAAKIQ